MGGGKPNLGESVLKKLSSFALSCSGGGSLLPFVLMEVDHDFQNAECYTRRGKALKEHEGKLFRLHDAKPYIGNEGNEAYYYDCIVKLCGARLKQSVEENGEEVWTSCRPLHN